jgi:hypothetical protein
MPRDPHSGNKVSKAPDREIGKPGGESWKSNRAPGLTADGSFPRPKEAPQPSVPIAGCRYATNSFDQELPDAWSSPSAEGWRAVHLRAPDSDGVCGPAPTIDVVDAVEPFPLSLERIVDPGTLRYATPREKPGEPGDRRERPAIHALRSRAYDLAPFLVVRGVGNAPLDLIR